MEKVIKNTDWRNRLIRWFYTREIVEMEAPTYSPFWSPENTCSLYYHLFWAILLSPIRWTALMIEKVLFGSEKIEVGKGNTRWNGFCYSICGMFISVGISFITIAFFGIIIGYDKLYWSSFVINPFIIYINMFVLAFLYRYTYKFITYVKEKTCKPIKFE